MTRKDLTNLVLIIGLSLMSLFNYRYQPPPPNFISNSADSNDDAGEREGEKAATNLLMSSNSADDNADAEAVTELLKSSNSSDYVWLGNHWIPPAGVPTFTPSQILEYFQKRNVLFVGDSTCRRSYATLFGLMNATDRNNVDVQSIDEASIIDYGKGDNFRGGCQLKDRIHGLGYVLCRDLPNDTHPVLDVDINTNVTLKKRDRFDLVSHVCYSEVEYMFRQDEDNLPFLARVKQNYDLVVIANGIWEVTTRACTVKEVTNSTAEDRLERLLNNIQNASSPELQIAFRTSGFDHKRGGDDIVWDLIHHSNEFFQNVSANAADRGDEMSNLTLVDWGSVIFKRSFGVDRIEGDIPPHYGLEGRLLFIQQLMHELKKAEA